MKAYFKDFERKKVYVEVTDKQSKIIREELRKEWRATANEKNHTVSLERLLEMGFDISDEASDTEKIVEDQEEKVVTAFRIRTLRKALNELSVTQRRTIYKLFVKNMTQAEIAREEGVTRWSINDRVEGIFHKLRKILEKKENFFEKTPPQTPKNFLSSEGDCKNSLNEKDSEK